jgi:hypothetical protein
VHIHKLEGSPDLDGASDDQGVRIADPLLPSVVVESLEQSEAPAEQCWTITELRFPVVITESH